MAQLHERYDDDDDAKGGRKALTFGATQEPLPRSTSKIQYVLSKRSAKLAYCVVS